MKINIQEIVKELQSLITHKILIGNDILDEYHHDEMNTLVAKPDLVVKPISTEEVSSIMKVASKYNIPVLARGSGTGLVGGAVAINGGIVIDMRLMNKIIELDENNLTIRVQPGVLLLELSQYVESKNFFYPPDPGEKTATIGGNISTNAGGMRAVKYGVTRPYVRALTVVLASGEILKLGSKTVKNSSGYDLLDLMIGSEGTLGVITEATLRLIPLPLYTLSLLVPYKDMPTALNTVGKLLRFKVLPVAIEFMTRQTLIYVEEFLNKKFPDTKHEAYLLLTFDANNEQTLNYEYTEAADLCLENGAIDVLLVNNDDRKKTV
jgi:glycolate oxidase